MFVSLSLSLNVCLCAWYCVWLDWLQRRSHEPKLFLRGPGNLGIEGRFLLFRLWRDKKGQLGDSGELGAPTYASFGWRAVLFQRPP